jgi:hypothetical protein
MKQVQQSIKKCIEALTRTTSDEAVLLALEGANCSVGNNGYANILLPGKTTEGENGHRDASRLIGGVIYLAFANSGMNARDAKFARTQLKGNSPDYNTEIVEFRLPLGSETKFADALDAITQKIETTQPLKLQIDRGIRYAREHVTKIPGAKAYVMFNSKEDGEIAAQLYVHGLGKMKLQTIGAISHVGPDIFKLMVDEAGDIDIPLENSEPGNKMLHALKTVARAVEKSEGKEGPGGGRGAR